MPNSVTIQGTASLPDKLAEVQVTLDGGLITSVEQDAARYRTPTITLTRDQILCPGFLDVQINGGFGKEFKTDIDSVQHVSKQIVQFGVTGFMPTITTKELSTYRRHIEDLLRNIVDDTLSAFVLGFHIEGPALNPQKRGAHPEGLLRTPDQVDLELITHPAVKIVTLAPEMPGGCRLHVVRQANVLRGCRGRSPSFHTARLSQCLPGRLLGWAGAGVGGPVAPNSPHHLLPQVRLSRARSRDVALEDSA